ncbi:MAG TPA: LysM peptidoglycan-binding domain-containing protein [Mycobacteriales bacterium]|jgi:LysM repeat protein
MTVAPELPPVLARRGASRRLRVVVDRTPAGVVALVEPPRPRGPLAPVRTSVVVPAAPVEPGIGREHRPADPARRAAAAGREHDPADPAFPRSSRRGPADPASPGRAGSRAAVLGGRSVLAQAAVRPATEPIPGDLAQARPAGSVPVRLPPERTRAIVSRPVGARVVRPAPGHLRLTRRGRLVTVAAAVLIAALTPVGVVSRAGTLRETAPVPASAPAQLVVAPGETLWSIAERVAPDRDPRTVVAGIQQLNDLPTPDVHAGQTLLLRRP